MALNLGIAVFVAMAFYVEAVGAWARPLGASVGRAAAGYSMHVRIATAGRFFSVIAAPLLGYLVDTGAGAARMAVIAGLTFTVLTGALIVAVFVLRAWHLALFARFFGLSDPGAVPGLTNLRAGRRFVIFCAAAFAFWAMSLFVVNYAGALIPGYRAMLVQMTAIITAAGTLLHVFLVDPVLSDASDRSTDEGFARVEEFIFARIVASSLLALFFFALALV